MESTQGPDTVGGSSGKKTWSWNSKGTFAVRRFLRLLNFPRLSEEFVVVTRATLTVLHPVLWRECIKGMRCDMDVSESL
jgi:hypothetical protein